MKIYAQTNTNLFLCGSVVCTIVHRSVLITLGLGTVQTLVYFFRLSTDPYFIELSTDPDGYNLVLTDSFIQFVLVIEFTMIEP